MLPKWNGSQEPITLEFLTVRWLKKRWMIRRGWEAATGTSSDANFTLIFFLLWLLSLLSQFFLFHKEKASISSFLFPKTGVGGERTLSKRQMLEDWKVRAMFKTWSPNKYLPCIWALVVCWFVLILIFFWTRISYSSHWPHIPYVTKSGLQFLIFLLLASQG